MKEDLFIQLLSKETKSQIIISFWERLLNIKQFIFYAETDSKDENGWNRKGQGKVVSIKNEDNVLIFNEQGAWQDKQKIDISFNNVLRWTVDHKMNRISLEHLRYGPNHPVFLLHFIPSSNNFLSSLNSHLCKKDTYFGQLYLDQHRLQLSWRIQGPKKNEKLNYYYF